MRKESAHAAIDQSYFERGRAEAALAHHREAIEYFDRHLALRPDDAAAYRARGFSRLEEAQPARAMGDFESAIALEPRLEVSLLPTIEYAARLARLEGAGAPAELATIYCERAGELLDSGDVVNAACWFARALDRKKNHAESWRGRGVARLRMGRAREALKDLTRAIALDEELSVAYADRARAKRAVGDLEGATHDFVHHLGFAPNDAAAWLDLGVVRLELGRRDGATLAFRRATLLKPDLRTQVARALSTVDENVVAEAKGRCEETQYDAAIALLDPLLAHEPDHLVALWWRALARQHSGHHAAAVADWDRAIPLWADKAGHAYYSRGSSLLALKRYPAALEDFDTLLRIEPGDPDGLYGRALALQRLGQWKESKDAAVALLAARPGDRNALKLRAHGARMLGDHEGAISDYDDHLHMFPLDAEAWFSRAFRCLDAMRFDEAVDSAKRAYAYEQVQKREPTYVIDFVARARTAKRGNLAAIYCERGDAKAEQGELVTACQWFTRALEAKSDFAPALSARGNARFELGAYAAALSDLRAALARNPRQRSAYVVERVRIAEQRVQTRTPPAPKRNAENKAASP